MTSSTQHIVFLHGWGLCGRIFSSFAAQVPEGYTAHCPDLPGHGNTPMQPGMTIEDVIDTLTTRFPFPVHVVGWSLGGLIAQYWAHRNPTQISSLFLLSTGPKLVIDTDWAYGQRTAALYKLADQFSLHFASQLSYFLQLQIQGIPEARGLLKQLYAAVIAEPENDLHLTLPWLLDGDSRPFVNTIRCPVTLCFGMKDRMTPPQGMNWLEEHIPNTHSTLFRQAAHMPFLSHEAACVTLLHHHLEKKKNDE